MALKACKDCGTQISTSAKACPKCGAKPAKFKWWLWGPLAIVVLFFAFPYIAYTSAERVAISARADCERVFPLERGGKCNQVYNEALMKAKQK